jgi:hypothetical protein
MVFDPRLEEFVRRTYDVGRRRRVVLDGDRRHVRVLTAEGTHGVNAEWLDAGANTVRREVNGPALVAVPATEKDARRTARRQELRFAAAFRAEAGGEFGMWLPNPMWSFCETSRSGQVAAVARLEGASVTLVRLDQLDENLAVSSATDAVLRWLVLVHPDLAVMLRTTESIDRRAAERVRGYFEVLHDRRPEIHELETLVFQHRGAWFAWCVSAPRTLYSQYREDFAWMEERLELWREGFAPTLQGPLAERAK